VISSWAVVLFAQNFGQIFMYLSTAMVDSWWMQSEVMAASYLFHDEGDGLILSEWHS
jgi:hypothetical protein